MGIVIDHFLSRRLNHDHTAQFNNLYILKAGDVATGTIVFPITAAQGNAFINSINAGTNTIDAARIRLWPRFFMMMGA